MENATKYRKKRRGDKGRSTKAHTFVQAILIAPSGRRIPLPRRSYYTQKYVNRQNRLRKEGRRRMLACLRTSKLRAMLEREAHAEDAAWFAGGRTSGDGRDKIVELFPTLRRTGSGG